METQQAFLDQLIQKQVQVEKSYRKRSFPLNTLSEMQEDTLVVRGNQHTQFDLWLYPAGKSLQFQLGNVSFPSNEAEIPESSLAELQRLARFLRENPDMHAQMDVYTQGPCSYGFALELTRDRAACIEGFLVYQEGVPADRISVRGRGKEVPPSSADDAEKQRGSQHIALTFTTKRQ
jgi:outer membrane protein OmpA-like peptidoglycan-associated protein